MALWNIQDIACSHIEIEWAYKSGHSENCARNPRHCPFVFVEFLTSLNWKSRDAMCMVNKTGTLPHGVSWVTVLVDQHIAKNCLFHAQFYSFKESTKENNPSLLWIQEFNKTQIIYLQCLRFLAQLFRKLEWPLLYTLDCQLRLVFLWGDVVHCSVTTPTFDKRFIYVELHVSIDLIFPDQTFHWLPSLRKG